MSHNDVRKAYMAQLIFFDLTEHSENNREILAKIALGFSGDDEGIKIQLSELICKLKWNEYQNTMSMLALRANIVIHWSEDDLTRLRQWAGV